MVSSLSDLWKMMVFTLSDISGQWWVLIREGPDLICVLREYFHCFENCWEIVAGQILKLADILNNKVYVIKRAHLKLEGKNQGRS